MKRYIEVAAVLVLGFLVCSVSSVSLGQEEEEIEYSWGTVISVSSNRITVSEHDYDSGKEVAVTYIVDPEVEFINVELLKDIAVDDSIEINYVVRDGKKVAKLIAVEKSSYEEYAPPETYEAETEYSPEEK